jgi:hypothetical protein
VKEAEHRFSAWRRRHNGVSGERGGAYSSARISPDETAFDPDALEDVRNAAAFYEDSQPCLGKAFLIIPPENNVVNKAYNKVYNPAMMA